MIAPNESNFGKKEANRKRLHKFLYLRRKNISLAVDIQNYLQHNKGLKEADQVALESLKRKVSSCGVDVLLHDKADYMEYITARKCSHKLCAICNEERKQILRRKYILFFKDNPTLFTDVDNDVKTAGNCMQKIQEVPYDLMSLTLTVPHANGRYKGKSFYYDTILQDFTNMRRKRDWNDLVYGGECGIETTVNDNGLHIHIHALLIVRQGKQNRNVLHRRILLMWNRITNDTSNYSEFTESHIKMIKRGNPLITDKDIKVLRRGGATLIALENIYERDKATGIKRYGTERARIKAVLECISYHFKPNMFDMGDGHCDIFTILNVYKRLKHKKLYQKFGVLKNEQILNLSHRDTEGLETAKEVENAIADDQLQVDGSGLYYIAKSKYLYIDEDGDVRTRKASTVIDLDTNSTKNAIKILNNRR